MKFTLLCLLCALAPLEAFADLRAQVYVSGLTNPVAFVQDPSNAAIQYVVEQGGLIKIVQNGTVLATPFLSLTGAIAAGGERGLLGLAFPPDYGSSGRLYVNFTNADGHTVVARFRRSANPLIADPASRFDLRWSTGERFIRQPYANHNGGNLVFGSDGMLYIGMGDGGSGNDPENRAQDPASLLGKMLRVNVGVPDSNTAGFSIPADNPFAGGGAAPEIWAFGLRNPWRFSVDDVARGGTGAIVIGDVGQSTREEIDYEPAGRGGRNYGWRNREGTVDNVTSLPPAFLPLTDPIYDYGRTVGQSVTGGFVYRGSALGPGYRGRYFFGDFIAGRVWSMALAIDTAGEAHASNIIDHTPELVAGAPIGLVSSFGVDAAGELYIVSYGGAILRVVAAPHVARPLMRIDAPANGARLRQPFGMGGWTIDANAQFDTGIDAIHVWAYPDTGAAPIFAGVPSRGPRPDVAAAFGSQFLESGWGLLVRGLPPGGYRIVAYGRVASTGAFSAVDVRSVAIEGGSLLAVDAPAPFAAVGRTFIVGGWALDPAASAGTGVDTIHVWAYPVAPAAGAPVFLGVPSFGFRPDIAAIFGSQFGNAGFTLIVSSLPPGTWDVVVYVHSAVSGTFDTARLVRITIS